MSHICQEKNTRADGRYYFQKLKAKQQLKKKKKEMLTKPLQAIYTIF